MRMCCPAVGNRRHADDASAVNGANAGRGEGAGITDALFGETIEIGSGGAGVAVTARVRADVLTADPQDVGAFCGFGPASRFGAFTGPKLGESVGAARGRT